jgi:hypothetical protein
MAATVPHSKAKTERQEAEGKKGAKALGKIEGL